MIVFKTFLKVLNKCKMTVTMFTVMLIIFGAFSGTSNQTTGVFIESKPDIAIINNDENIGITKDFIDYISENSNVKEMENNSEKLDDALFYRDVNYIIYIPDNFRDDFLNGKNPKIEVKSTGDYMAHLSEMIIDKYIRVANIYVSESLSEDEVIKNIHDTLNDKTEVEITSKLDETGISKLAFFFNFANYSLLAGGIYVVCLILSSFKEDKIRKRTIISSMNDRKYNRQLLLSNSLFMICLWAFYCILGIILLGNIMFTKQGLICIINSFIFSMCSLTIAFLIGNIINNKNAINGIINVIALGSSFLCGAFVPMEWLPSSIISIAHILPSYYYIKTNELLKTIEVFNIETLKPIIANMIVIVVFMIIFTIFTSIISKKKRKLN